MESFLKKKEDEFTKSSEKLFNITVKSLYTSGLIAAEYCEFILQYYTTGTRPLALHGTRYTTKLQVEKKVARKEKRRNISSANITSQPSTTLDPSSGISISPELLVI